MIEQTEFGFTGSSADLPAWGTNPEMGFVAAQAAVIQFESSKAMFKCKQCELKVEVITVEGLCQVCDASQRQLQQRVDNLAGRLYAVYCRAVGGKAYDGQPLPDWAEFKADQAKQKQFQAWLRVAEASLAWLREAEVFQ